MEGRVELRNFLCTDTSVLSEQTECLTVSVKSTQVPHVFENGVEMAILGGCGEENTSIAPLNGVFLAGSFVVGSRLNLLDVTHSPWLEKIPCQINLLRSSSNFRLWGTNRLLRDWFWLGSGSHLFIYFIFSWNIWVFSRAFLLGKVTSSHGWHGALSDSKGALSGNKHLNTARVGRLEAFRDHIFANYIYYIP